MTAEQLIEEDVEDVVADQILEARGGDLEVGAVGGDVAEVPIEE